MMELVAFVIDDDEASRNSLKFLLRAEKIRARSFPSAAEFFEQILPEHCGCIVTDVRMPGMDGIALVSEVRKRGWVMPVIVITGHADVALAVEAMKRVHTTSSKNPSKAPSCCAVFEDAWKKARQWAPGKPSTP